MKKGFSFIVLVATVAVMLILVSTVVITGSNTANNSKKLSFATEINTLQSAVDAYASSNNGSLPTGDSIIVNVSNLSNEFKNQFLENNETISGNNIVLAEIDYSKIGYNSLKYGNGKDGQNDIYAVSPTTGKVYYAKGFSVGSSLYFTLTDDLKKRISYDTGSVNMQSSPYVIFTTSDSNWTNKSVEISAKLPEGYDLDSITINATNYTSYKSNNAGENKIYTITCDKNCDIVVKCHSTKVSSKVVEAKFSVKNIDKIAPKFEISVTQNRLDSVDDQEIYGYLTLNNVSDDSSGIKYIKYENNSAYDSRTLIDEQKYTINGHFETSGNVAHSNIIPIKKSVRQITVYIEDNAKNWTVQTVNVNI